MRGQAGSFRGGSSRGRGGSSRGGSSRGGLSRGGSSRGGSSRGRGISTHSSTRGVTKKQSPYGGSGARGRGNSKGDRGGRGDSIDYSRQNRDKFGKKEDTIPDAKALKKERQKAKFQKKGANSKEDFEFETVPLDKIQNPATKLNNRVDPETEGWESGSDIGGFSSENSVQDDSSADGNEEFESGSDADAEDQIESDGLNTRESDSDDSHADSNDILDDDQESNSDEEDETQAIAKQLKSANRKGKKSGGFQSMGLSYPIYKAIAQQGYRIPTPIQRKVIPIIMEGRDVVSMARTGSGKTAAFLIPLIERLKTHSAKVGARALILSPSRELATQTLKFFKDLAKFTDLRGCVFVGGDQLEDQFTALAGNPDVIVATPGRLMHLMIEMNMDMKAIEYIVFDEADRLFEMGFADQLREIMHRVPETRQTLLFSATLPRLLVDFARAGLQNPALLRLDVDTKISRNLQMYFFSVKPEEKEGALLYLLRECIPEDQQTVIFVSTKHHVEYVQEFLNAAGIEATYIYGALDQIARKIHLGRFQNGKIKILVVTDVAARGIDVPLLDNVINYDFPASSKIFVHRVGRTARAGKNGSAWSLISNDELPYMLDLQLFTGRPLVFASAFFDSALDTKNNAANKDDELCISKTSREPQYTAELVYGYLPPTHLGLEIEAAQQLIHGNITIETLRDSSRKGYQMYLKSRPTATRGSYARTKDIVTQHIGIHPMFAAKVGKSEFNRVEMIKSISNFRPTESVFEVGRRGMKSSEAVLMVKRRNLLAGKINAMKSHRIEKETKETLSQAHLISRHSTDLMADDDDLKIFGESDATTLLNANDKTAADHRKKVKGTDYRDKEHYLSYRPLDADTEMGYAVNAKQGNFSSSTFATSASQATIDLMQDDPDLLKKQQSQLKWDGKKHRFTRETVGADNKKRIRTDLGTLVPASFKSDRYERWSKRTRTDMPRTGDLELADAEQIANSAGNATGVRVYRHQRMLAPSIGSKSFDRKLGKMESQWRKDGMKSEEIKQKRLESMENAKMLKTVEMEAAKAQKAAKVKSEIKTASEIVKAREEKEKRRAKTGRHKHVLASQAQSSRGSSRGGGGGRGGSSRGGGRGRGGSSRGSGRGRGRR
ncbi:ATP-dependent RNA helicase dbp10 [Batrachochytrium dendrobatidis]|nr:ATP-dependent RNA helicase dbp10 [Batrachochytrium dendrobatidis]